MIYKNDVIWQKAEFLKDIKPKDIIKIRNIVKNAKKSFNYNKNEKFVSSIEIPLTFDIQIASYDIMGTEITETAYGIYLRDFLEECNSLLSTNHKYDKFKLELEGNWISGNIILLKRVM